VFDLLVRTPPVGGFPPGDPALGRRPVPTTAWANAPHPWPSGTGLSTSRWPARTR